MEPPHATKGQEPATRPPWALFMLMAIYACGFADRVILQVLVEPIRHEFGLSDTEIGLLTGLAFIVLNVGFGLVFARVAERRRRISMIAIGTVCWSFATAACGLAGSFVQLFLARVAVGVGEAVGLPMTASVVSDYYPKERRTTALSVLWAATPLGVLLGSAGGAMVAQAYGWRWAFVAAAIPGFLLALLLALTVGEPQRGRFDNLAPGSVDEVPPIGAVISRMWRRRSLRHILTGSIVGAAAAFGINAFLAAWLQRRFGLDLRDAGLAVGLVSSFPAILGVVGAGFLADRWARTDPRSYGWVPGIGVLLAGPLLVWALTRGTAEAAIGLLAVAAVFQYCYIGFYSGVLQNMMHPRMRASATAIITVVAAIFGSGLGPLLVGALSDHFAAPYREPGQALGYALLAAALLYFWSAAHFFLATRDLGKDLAAPIESDVPAAN